MMKKDGHNMVADYDKGHEVKILHHNGFQYVKLDDIIKWLNNNKEEAPEIETDWLIKVFVRLKNSTK